MTGWRAAVNGDSGTFPLSGGTPCNEVPSARSGRWVDAGATAAGPGRIRRGRRGRRLSRRGIYVQGK